MSWRQFGSEEGFKFREEVLPPGAIDALKSTPIQEVRSTGGVHQRTAETASSGALHQAAAGSGSANTQVILPRHRASVERYFERQNLTNPKR